MSDIAVSIKQLDVLFGPAKNRHKAIELLDNGLARDAILEQTGIVLGVADANLDVPSGSISVLMGLSGSGKSSLLRCINGLNTVTRGVLEVATPAGRVDVAACKGRALRDLRRNDLAMVFQQFGLLPWASVRENIGFGLSVRGENAALIKQRVDKQLELVGLEAWADKPIHTLSGGMQQRVGLARAFATDADILLMDEPFSALDPLIREHLQDELLSLQSQLKKTIVFVSHDLDEALKLGNQISIMDGGRIVQTGSVDDIVFNPANDYVRRFVANINPLSVLTAGVVMQPLHVTVEPVITHASGIQVRLDEGRPMSCAIDGAEFVLNPLQDSESVQQHAVVTVNRSTPISTLLKLAAKATKVSLVLDDNGILCGFVRRSDICAALVNSEANTAK